MPDAARKPWTTEQFEREHGRRPRDRDEFRRWSDAQRAALTPQQRLRRAKEAEALAASIVDPLLDRFEDLE